jgi:hypothetical protein
MGWGKVAHRHAVTLPSHAEPEAAAIVRGWRAPVNGEEQRVLGQEQAATHDATLQLAIRDDGIGGADLSQGSGLLGLRDRIEAFGGTLQLISPAGHGTTLLIKVPIEIQGNAISPEP